MKTTKNLSAKKLIALFIGFTLLITTLTGILFGAKAARAETNGKLNFILQNISTDNVEINNDSFEIYGNSTLTDKEFRDVVNTGSPKIYLHYRTDRNIDLPYDALLEVKTDSKTYSYEFVEEEQSDAQTILSEIKTFIEKYSDKINDEIAIAPVLNAPMALDSDIPTTFINTIVQKQFAVRFGDMGYITYDIGVRRQVINSDSILYIVTVHNIFTPGVIAKENGESGYDSYKNYKGYVHMTVEQAYDANEEYYYGKRWGTVPYKKDFWPINQPSTVTITSSINSGLTLGNSMVNGFSIGGNIVFGYSKSITQQDPALSAQVNSSNLDKCEWNYEYDDDKAESYHLFTNYMFEMSNSRADMFIGDFRLKLDYSFSVDKGLFWKHKTNTHSADLIVRAGEYKSIYNFRSGMI